MAMLWGWNQVGQFSQLVHSGYTNFALGMNEYVALPAFFYVWSFGLLSDPTNVVNPTWILEVAPRYGDSISPRSDTKVTGLVRLRPPLLPRASHG